MLPFALGAPALQRHGRGRHFAFSAQRIISTRTDHPSFSFAASITNGPSPAITRTRLIATLPTRPKLYFSSEELAGLLRLSLTRRCPDLLAVTLRHVTAQGEPISDFRTELSPSDRTWLAQTLTAGALSACP